MTAREEKLKAKLPDSAITVFKNDITVFKNERAPEMVVLVTGRRLTPEETKTIESFIRNTCPHCGEHVNVPSSYDGVEFACRSCGKLSVWTAFGDESWALVAYDEEPLTTGDEDMGIHADAKEMARVSGLDVQVCKKALLEKRDEAASLSTNERLELCFPDGPPAGHVVPDLDEEVDEAPAEAPKAETPDALTPPSGPATGGGALASPGVESKAGVSDPADTVTAEDAPNEPNAKPVTAENAPDAPNAKPSEPEHIVTTDKEVIDTGVDDEASDS